MADLDPDSAARRRRATRAPAPFVISDVEEARIQAEIADDPDNPELTDAQLARMRPAADVLPPALYAGLVRRGRPKAEVTKTPVKLRLDPDIVAGFKKTGPGWQTRINDALRVVLVELGAAQSGPAVTSKSTTATTASATKRSAKAKVVKAS